MEAPAADAEPPRELPRLKLLPETAADSEKKEGKVFLEKTRALIKVVGHPEFADCQSRLRRFATGEICNACGKLRVVHPSNRSPHGESQLFSLA